jgi:farnesol dehydrogenase
MNVFLTGATGFIGQKLLGLLVGRGDTVHVLSRSPLPECSVNVLEFRGDILKREDVNRAMQGCNVAYHLAGYARNWARDASVFYRVNVGGTAVVLEAARSCGLTRVVYTSSAMVLGPSNDVPVTESSVRIAPVLTDYERSKIAAEERVVSEAQDGLETVVVCPTRVFGPGLLNEGNSATQMIKMYIEGKWRILPGDGTALGNYAYVADVARGHLCAMEQGWSGERYILGGENVSYLTLFDEIAGIAGVKRRMMHLPRRLAMTAAHAEEVRARIFHGYPAVTPGWAATFLTDCACSSAKAERELDYRITPLRRALRETVDWLREKERNE